MSSFQGSLDVRVVEGRQLKDQDFLGKMDPYVVIRVGTESKKTTAISNGGKNPTINQTLQFNVIPGVHELNLEVYDKDLMGDAFIGSGGIQIDQVFRAGTYDTQVELRGKDGRFAGNVRLILTFYNKAGAPAGIAAPAYVAQPYAAAAPAGQYQPPPPQQAYAPPPQPQNPYPTAAAPYGAYPPQPMATGYGAPPPAAYPPQPYGAPPPAAYPPPNAYPTGAYPPPAQGYPPNVPNPYGPPPPANYMQQQPPQPYGAPPPAAYPPPNAYPTGAYPPPAQGYPPNAGYRPPY